VLTSHDESLLHQMPLPMAQASTSDHRFYDRVFLTAVNPAGGPSLAMGMGVYKNMNAIDGFSVLALPDMQQNVRVSRPLRPQFETEVQGLRYDIIEPQREIRFSLGGDHPLTYDLSWRATFPVLMEEKWWGTHKLVNERLAIDVCRYEQTGRVNGWIALGEERFEVEDWFGGRDHSWGMRVDVGGFEPHMAAGCLTEQGCCSPGSCLIVGNLAGSSQQPKIRTANFAAIMACCILSAMRQKRFKSLMFRSRRIFHEARVTINLPG
jgi:hypothetical protein